MRSVVRQGTLRVAFTDAGAGQAFVVASAGGPEDAGRAAAVAYRTIADLLRTRGLTIVHERIFGSLASEEAVREARRGALGQETALATCAPTYVQARPTWGDGLAGVILQAVAPGPDGDAVETLWHGSRPVGRRWKRDGRQRVVLQNLDGVDWESSADNSAEAQVRRLLERAFALLAEAGIGPQGLVRTWFYLDDILGQYPAFNRLRNERFAAAGYFAGDRRVPSLPASTAIGASNARGAAAVLDLIAVAGKDAADVDRLSSPSQPEAFSYGSAFSRAAILRDADVGILHLSGTAAIGEAGESLFDHDAAAQIHAALARIQSLLSHHGASVEDIAAATVFLKRAEDRDLFDQALRGFDLGDLPCVVVVAEVCRDELLFELDGEVLLAAPERAP